MAEPNPSLERHTGGHPGDVFFRRPRLHHRGLHHVLGVSALFSSAYGNVGSSIYYALGVTALYALGLTPAVFIFSGLIFACTALTYAEGATAIPEAGGSSTFARRAFNDLAGFLAGWSLMLGYIVTIGISAFAVPNYLSFFLPVLKVWPLNSIVGIGVVAALAAVNVAGVKESAWLNITLALLDLLTQTLLVIVGFFTLFNVHTLISNVHWGVAPTWGNLLLGISVSMIAYTGIETVSNLAEETRSPGRNIPRSIILVVITVLGMFGLISTLALSAMPVYQDPSGVWTTELAEKWIDDPVLGLVSKMPEGVRAISGTWVALLAATILIIATNAGILGLSRLSY
ncbi:MAG: UspA domain protein, partial [Dehalococcoidia bacterium]|nr:UspA domain protein [Dehalococcoidia bacterium]